MAKRPAWSVASHNVGPDLDASQWSGGGHGAGRALSLRRGVAGDGLKMTRNLTSACTRPPGARPLSISCRAARDARRYVARIVEA
jgi:hypothetical protein